MNTLERCKACNNLINHLIDEELCPECFSIAMETYKELLKKSLE